MLAFLTDGSRSALTRMLDQFGVPPRQSRLIIGATKSHHNRDLATFHILVIGEMPDVVPLKRLAVAAVYATAFQHERIRPKCHGPFSAPQ